MAWLSSSKNGDSFCTTIYPTQTFRFLFFNFCEITDCEKFVICQSISRFFLQARYIARLINKTWEFHLNKCFGKYQASVFWEQVRKKSYDNFSVNTLRPKRRTSRDDNDVFSTHSNHTWFNDSSYSKLIEMFFKSAHKYKKRRRKKMLPNLVCLLIYSFEALNMAKIIKASGLESFKR